MPSPKKTFLNLWFKTVAMKQKWEVLKTFFGALLRNTECFIIRRT